MQQLLVTVLAVHLMSVVAGPGRAGAAPVQQPPSTGATAVRPSTHHRLPGHHKSHALSDLSPWTEKQLDSRKERSLAIWTLSQPHKFLTNALGWTLVIMPDGTVSSTREDKPRFGIFQTEGVNAEHLVAVKNSTRYGKVALLGFHSNRYLCMGRNGHLYTRSHDKPFTEECVFVEKMRPHFYFTYCSFKFPDRKSGERKRKWCLGIGRDGTVRLGRKTKERHLFAQFQTRTAVAEDTTPLPRPAVQPTHPVRGVTPRPPSGEVIRGTSPGESRPQKGKKHKKRKDRRRKQRKKKRRNRPKEKDDRECKGPGLFNIRCRDDSDVITVISQLTRKSSRRRARGRSRSSKSSQRKDDRTSSHIDSGLFHG